MMKPRTGKLPRKLFGIRTKAAGRGVLYWNIDSWRSAHPDRLLTAVEADAALQKLSQDGHDAIIVNVDTLNRVHEIYNQGYASIINVSSSRKYSVEAELKAVEAGLLAVKLAGFDDFNTELIAGSQVEASG